MEINCQELGVYSATVVESVEADGAEGGVFGGMLISAVG